ncbi:hypothetical protein BH11ARM2_BH11ARM2_02950 [soil metagenome]
MLAILTVLSGILFPVLASARESARKTACLSHFRQAARGITLYGSDYDDLMVPANHQLDQPADSANDRTWVQLLLPYARSFDNFVCPSDHTRASLKATYDDDLVVGDIDSRYYTASQRSNIGYNFLNLAPIFREHGRWVSRPRSETSIESPSNTLLFADSVWDRTETGEPTGGGSWLIVPPCRYVEPVVTSGGGGGGTHMAQPIDAFTGLTASVEVYTPGNGWTSDEATSRLQYGGAWPWHRGRLTVAMLDGSVRSEAPNALGRGCDVQPRWMGLIKDTSAYVWDSQ